MFVLCPLFCSCTVIVHVGPHQPKAAFLKPTYQIKYIFMNVSEYLIKPGFSFGEYYSFLEIHDAGPPGQS